MSIELFSFEPRKSLRVNAVSESLLTAYSTLVNAGVVSSIEILGLDEKSFRKNFPSYVDKFHWKATDCTLTILKP